MAEINTDLARFRRMTLTDHAEQLAQATTPDGIQTAARTLRTELEPHVVIDDDVADVAVGALSTIINHDFDLGEDVPTCIDFALKSVAELEQG